MKEINAVQNNDGTWHVVIKNQYTTYDVENGATVENHCISTTDIPRADVKIIAYQDMDADETIFTIEI